MISVLVVGRCSREVITDICMTARAFGASRAAFTCKGDKKAVSSIGRISKIWGGKFSISFDADYKKVIGSSPNYKKVFLTQYGLPVEKVNHSLRTYKNVMLIVSLTEKFTQRLIDMSDFNVSITSQPHSSVSAIAVFLHTYFNGRENAMQFENAKSKVIPSERGIHIQKHE